MVGGAHPTSSQPRDWFGRGGGEDFSGDAGVEAEFAGIDEALQHRGHEVFDADRFRRGFRRVAGRLADDLARLDASA